MHAHLEATVDVFDQLQSVERYSALLARFLGFYAPLEDRLAHVLAGTPTEISFAERRKVPWLVADLRYLGCDAAALDQLPRCQEIPPAVHLSSALGCLYVLEGATLGGNVIRPHVERQLGLGPGRGCTFFSSYGDEVGEMWQSFCHYLCNFADVTPGVNDEIVDAAADTFTSFDRWVAGAPA
jgi:heme oxygenase